MAVTQGTHEHKQDSRKNARWSKEDDRVFVDVLKDQQSKGNQADNGWKRIVWTACEQALRNGEIQSGGGPQDRQGMQGTLAYGAFDIGSVAAALRLTHAIRRVNHISPSRSS